MCHFRSIQYTGKVNTVVERNMRKSKWLYLVDLLLQTAAESLLIHMTKWYLNAHFYNFIAGCIGQTGKKMK